MATISQQPTTRKLPDDLKVRIQNKQEFDQVVAALKKDGREWRHCQQPWNSNVVGVYAVNSYILYTDSQREFRDDSSQEMTVNQILEITFEEYCGPNVVNWYDLKVGDIVTVDNYPKECTVTMVEPSTYLGNHVVKLQNDVKQFWRFKDTEYRLIKRASPVETQPTENKVPETVQAPSSKGWIIGNLNAKSKIEISDNPRIHSTIDAAETERLRLMNAHVGETFVILEIKSYGKVETNPVTKIW